MVRIYFGYRMVDGKIEVNDVEAEQIRNLYQNYLLGDAIKTAGTKAGILKHHGSLGRILRHEIYTGTRSYPQIIPKEIYQQAQEERSKRRDQLGKNFEPRESVMIIQTSFEWKSNKVSQTNPWDEAEQYYQLIEVIE